MKITITGCAALLVLTWSAPLQAQLEPPTDQNPNRIGLSYRAGFNITAQFSGLGGFPRQSAPGPATGGGINRNYDDGYNRVDSAGNAGGETWYWGYAGAPGQNPGNDTIVMHSATAEANGVSDDQNGDPQHGIELTFNRQLGTLGKSPWGVELAFNFMDLTVRDNSAVRGPATVISDAFALDGVTPPLPPYAGTFSGPGALLGDSPSRTVATVADAALISGSRNLSASVFGWRVGPYLQLPLDRYFSFSVSGGLAAALVDSDFDFHNSVSIGAAGPLARSGSGSDCDVLWGGYVGGTLSCAVNERLSLFAGVQFQALQTFSQTAGGAKAEIDFGKSLFATAGVGWSF